MFTKKLASKVKKREETKSTSDTETVCSVRLAPNVLSEDSQSEPKVEDNLKDLGSGSFPSMATANDPQEKPERL
jgi:hypothetical protein